MIEIKSINIQETIRYLGNKNVKLNHDFQLMFQQCEKELLNIITPKCLYKVLALPYSEILAGQDIYAHLKDCEKAVIMCGTLGSGADNLIRKYQIVNIAKAVLIDAMASVTIEEVMNQSERTVLKENQDYNSTWRFSPGYGDYPIEMQKLYLQLLDAPKKIGLCTNENFLLTPTKSVTAIMGLSKKTISQNAKNCATCNLADNCNFRKDGKRCDN